MGTLCLLTKVTEAGDELDHRPHRLAPAPPLAYYLTYRICLGLQRPTGRYSITESKRHHPPATAWRIHRSPPIPRCRRRSRPPPSRALPGARVSQRMSQLGAAGHPVPGSLYRPDPPAETAALQAARDGNSER